MSEAPLDLVVIGFSGEMRALKLMARSLRLYAEPGLFGQLLFIVNEHSSKAFRRYFESDVRPELGPYSAQARVLEGAQVAGHSLGKKGWRSQQSLKLLAANAVSSPAYLILDSKNHFIRPVERASFLADDGRLRSNMYPLNKKFAPLFENACRYFGVDDYDLSADAMPTATPFLMQTNLVKALISTVIEREGRNFHDHFMQSRAFTEFYLYYAFVLAQPGGFEAVYERRSKPYVSIFSGAAEDVDYVRDHLSIIEDPDIYCFGIHRHVFEVGQNDILEMVRAVWKRFGLVENDEEARYFQVFEPPRRKRRFLFF